MRKTLLIAAAALAAGVISSEAGVYSQNIVGYVNIPVPNNSYQLVANQLDTGSNTVDNVFQSGAVSSDTTVLYWTGTAFQQYIYYNSGDSPDGGQGWYAVAGSQPPATNSLAPGTGVFAHNGSGAAITLTTVGTVLTGTNLIPVKTGQFIYSYPVPLGGQSLDAMGYPATSSADTCLIWNGTGYNQYIYYNADDSPDGGNGWYQTYGAGTNVSGTPSAWPNAGGSLFINHPLPPVTWTNVFNVQ